MVRTMLYGKGSNTISLFDTENMPWRLFESCTHEHDQDKKTLSFFVCVQYVLVSREDFQRSSPLKVLIYRTAVQVLVYTNEESLPLHSSFTLCIYVVRWNYKNVFVSPAIYTLPLN